MFISAIERSESFQDKNKLVSLSCKLQYWISAVEQIPFLTVFQCLSLFQESELDSEVENLK